MSICFTLIPYFKDVFWWEWYTDVSLSMDDIVMTFVKNGSINTIFWNYILVSRKYKINTRHWVIYNICWLINDLCMSCWWCKRSYFSTSWISNDLFVQPALKSTTTIEQRGNSPFFWLRRTSNFVQKISNFLTLIRWVVCTGWKAYFALWSNFCN